MQLSDIEEQLRVARTRLAEVERILAAIARSGGTGAEPKDDVTWD